MQSAPALPSSNGRAHAAPAPAVVGFTEDELAGLEAQYEDIALFKGNLERDPKRYFEIVLRLDPTAFKVYTANYVKDERRHIAAELLFRSTVVAVFWQGDKVLDAKVAKVRLDAVLKRLPRLPVSENAQSIIAQLYGDVAPAEEKA